MSSNNPLVGLDGGGVVHVRSIAPREIQKSPCQWFTGIIASTAEDKDGGADSKEIRAGQIMALITATARWVPWRGADVISLIAVASVIVNVGTTNYRRFAVGNNLKVGFMNPDALVADTVEDMGAITAVSNNGAITATTGVASQYPVGTTVFVEPTTGDGSGVAQGILMDNAEMRLREAGFTACERQARIAYHGTVQSAMVLGAARRARLQLAGQTPLPRASLYWD